MNYLARVKYDLEQRPINRSGKPEMIVDAYALKQLVESYEKMDSEFRSLHGHKSFAPIEKRLHDDLTAMYLAYGKQTDACIRIIMQTLLPLIEEKFRAEDPSRTTYPLDFGN